LRLFGRGVAVIAAAIFFALIPLIGLPLYIALSPIGLALAFYPLVMTNVVLTRRGTNPNQHP
jgi:hypothetical protein